MPTKFFDLKREEFSSIFHTEEEVRLSPYDDDKRKSGKIIPFQAGSDRSPMLTVKNRSVLSAAFASKSPNGKSKIVDTILNMICAALILTEPFSIVSSIEIYGVTSQMRIKIIVPKMLKSRCTIAAFLAS